MSYNTKNYVEQGGERLVIGGEMEFKEGARVTGLPTAIVLDFHGQSVAQAFADAVDVTEAIPMEQFLEATRCESPIIFRGLEMEGNEVGVQGAATMTGQGIYAMAGYNGNGAQLLGVITLLLYTYDDKVWLRVSALIPFEDEYVDGVNVYPDTMTMVIGNEQQITAEVIPDTAVNKATHWSSSDESVVTLNVTPANTSIRALRYTLPQLALAMQRSRSRPTKADTRRPAMSRWMSTTSKKWPRNKQRRLRGWKNCYRKSRQTSY